MKYWTDTGLDKKGVGKLRREGLIHIELRMEWSISGNTKGLQTS